MSTNAVITGPSSRMTLELTTLPRMYLGMALAEELNW